MVVHNFDRMEINFGQASLPVFGGYGCPSFLSELFICNLFLGLAYLGESHGCLYSVPWMKLTGNLFLKLLRPRKQKLRQPPQIAISH